MTTGNKIKHFRLLKGHSQEKMAELLGISPKAYGNIERNITDVNLSRLQQIADTLEVELPKLLDLDGKKIIQGDNNNHNVNILDSIVQRNENEEISKLAHANEKLSMENLHLKEKNQLLEGKIGNLEEVIALMKEKK